DALPILAGQSVQRSNVFRRLAIDKGFPCQTWLDATLGRITGYRHAQQTTFVTFEHTGIRMVGGGIKGYFGHRTVRMDRLGMANRSNVANVADFVPQNAADHSAGVYIRNRRQFAFGIGRALHTVGPQQLLLGTGIPLIVVSRNVQTPGFEGVIDAHQRGVQLREVTVQHVHHGVVFYPVITFLSINFRGVVRGEETVRNDATGSVHDENLECGFAEGEAFRTHSFRHHADQCVDHFNVVVIQTLQIGQGFRIFGQIFKLGDRVQANLTTEFVVTRYTTLTVTDYVDSGDVHFADDRQIQITQEFRVVVQYQGARVGDTEGVPQTVRTFTVQHVFGGAVTGFFQGNALVDDVRTDVVNIDIVTHQRVHTVNRDEFFGQGKRNTGVVRLTRTSQTGNRPFQEVAFFHGFRQFRVNTQDATDPGIFFGQIFIDLVQFGAVLVTIVGVTSQTQTVGVHGTLGNRVGNDGRRPFNRVNFRHQGGVDQTGFVVQPLIIFIRVAGRQCLSNSVVLFYEQLVQHAQTDPPVIHKTGFRQAREEFTRQGAIGIHGQT